MVTQQLTIQILSTEFYISFEITNSKLDWNTEFLHNVVNINKYYF